jgi:hypothetical protein
LEGRGKHTSLFDYWRESFAKKSDRSSEVAKTIPPLPDPITPILRTGTRIHSITSKECVSFFKFFGHFLFYINICFPKLEMLQKRKLDGKEKLSQSKNSSKEMDFPRSKTKKSILDLSEPSKDLSIDLCGDEKDDEKEQQRISFQNHSPEHYQMKGSIIRQFH